ncbi:MAG: GNAT family N-acetyltransferase [Chloroflexota bacterium]|jgi:putative acetyltransferase
MSIVIARELPTTPDVTQLINDLQSYLEQFYPPESQHGFSVEMLVEQQVDFFVGRINGVAAGCCGIKFYEYDGGFGEIKRMYVAPAFRGYGLGKQLLQVVEAHARQQGVAKLRLETGIHQTEALGLYTWFGFAQIAPFGEYTNDPLSLCYEKELT